MDNGTQTSRRDTAAGSYVPIYPAVSLHLAPCPIAGQVRQVCSHGCISCQIRVHQESEASGELALYCICAHLDPNRILSCIDSRQPVAHTNTANWNFVAAAAQPVIGQHSRSGHQDVYGPPYMGSHQDVYGPPLGGYGGTRLPPYMDSYGGTRLPPIMPSYRSPYMYLDENGMNSYGGMRIPEPPSSYPYGGARLPPLPSRYSYGSFVPLGAPNTSQQGEPSSAPAGGDAIVDPPTGDDDSTSSASTRTLVAESEGSPEGEEHLPPPRHQAVTALNYRNTYANAPWSVYGPQHGEPSSAPAGGDAIADRAGSDGSASNPILVAESEALPEGEEHVPRPRLPPVVPEPLPEDEQPHGPDVVLPAPAGGAARQVRTPRLEPRPQAAGGDMWEISPLWPAPRPRSASETEVEITVYIDWDSAAAAAGAWRSEDLTDSASRATARAVLRALSASQPTTMRSDLAPRTASEPRWLIAYAEARRTWPHSRSASSDRLSMRDLDSIFRYRLVYPLDAPADAAESCFTRYGLSCSGRSGALRWWRL
ncbi:hypothetical protein Daus18300_008459 [Diaporthe australafricana]|uniref:Uncharacterized protein n=1 Tax=Diaporthe australafricana TaxID=127596 RepID=A0ABR3WI61_9PEZI